MSHVHFFAAKKTLVYINNYLLNKAQGVLTIYTDAYQCYVTV